MQAPAQPAAAEAPLRILTSAEIQQMLEENAKLIAALVENQNLGKLEECSEYQKRLQANLYTLAKLADLQAKPAPAQQPAAAPPQ